MGGKWIESTLSYVKGLGRSTNVFAVSVTEPISAARVHLSDWPRCPAVWPTVFLLFCDLRSPFL